MNPMRRWPFFAVLSGAGAGLAIVCLVASGVKTEFDRLALTRGSAPQWAFDASHRRIQCNPLPQQHPCAPLSAIEKKAKKLLWLSASHAYVITGYRDGDTQVVELVSRYVAEQGMAMRVFSIGNASPREMYVALEYFLARDHYDYVLVGAVLDDMREPVRYTMFEPYLKDAETRERLSQDNTGRVILDNFGRSEVRSTAGRVARAEQRPPGGSGAGSGDADNVDADVFSEVAERWLKGMLDKYVPVWTARDELRGRIRVAFAHLSEQAGILRRRLAGQDYNWPLVEFSESVWESNAKAWHAIFSRIREIGAVPIVYISPRPDVSKRYFNYSDAIYTRFKNDIARSTEEVGGYFVNLEDVVPVASYPHMEYGGVGDVFHFDANGHRILATKVIEILKSVVDK